MKLLIRTTIEDTHVNAAIDILIPKIHSIDDLGKPLVSNKSETIWVYEYAGELENSTISVMLWVRKIKDGISICGRQTVTSKEE